MKKIGMLLIVLAVAYSTLPGQSSKTGQSTQKDMKTERKTPKVPLKKLATGVINPIAKDNFARDFGNVPAIKWERTTFYDEVVFSKAGKDYRAFYDPQGNLVGTTSVASINELPANVQNELKTKYKDYTLGKIVFYDDNEANSTDMYLYGLQFEDADNYFIELTKGSKRIVLQATPEGALFFFTEF
jgi:hypothetical protein